MSAPSITVNSPISNGVSVAASDINAITSTATLASTKTDVVFGRQTAGAGAAEEITCDTYGRALIGAGSVAAQLTALGIGSGGTLSGVALVSADRYEATVNALGTSGTVNLDFTAKCLNTCSLSGNITFTTSNLTAGRSKTIIISADSSSRTLTFPAGWIFLGGSAPASIAASKSGMLNLLSLGTTDATMVATWVVQS